MKQFENDVFIFDAQRYKMQANLKIMCVLPFSTVVIRKLLCGSREISAKYNQQQDKNRISDEKRKDVVYTIQN